MSIKDDRSSILNTIKAHYNFKSEADFARFLGIKPQTLSTWHSRNSFDVYLLYSKCKGINAEWLLSGYGEPFLSTTTINHQKENAAIDPEIKKKFVMLLAKDQDISEIFDLKVKTIVNLFLAELKADLVLNGTIEKYIDKKINESS